MQVRLRLLPIVITLAFLMLSVKSYELGKGLTLDPGGLQVAPLQAQQVAPLAPVAAPPATAAATTATADAPQVAQATTQGMADGAGEDQPLVQVKRTETLADPTFADRDDLTQSEIDVLQALAERRRQLDLREQEMQQREGLLKAAEQRVDEKIAELTVLQSTIEGLLRLHTDEEEQQLTNLVKIYENMKPKDAAEIFEQLDMPVMLDVIERMKERRVSPILAAMDPPTAQQITSEMANRRELPIPKE